jgi:precorrin-3B synthase
MSEASLKIVNEPHGGHNAACPGLYRIVPARDGGICRIRLPLGHLSAAQARAIAGAAGRFGSGVVEATNRANLQIRGIRRDSEAAIIARIIAAGLAPARPEADDVRNVMVSPAAGIDPQQHFDTRPFARNLLTLLETSEAGRALSPKFCILIDGGESMAAVDHPHDIWLASMARGAKMALGFAGAPPTAADDATSFVAVSRGQAAMAVAAALALFAREAAGDPAVTRFRHLVARGGRAGFLARLAQRLPGVIETGLEILTWRRPQTEPWAHIGLRDQLQTGLVLVGAVPPLGRLSPQMLRHLADIAEGFGDGGLRLTPWRSVFVPSVRHRSASRVVAALAQAGLTCDAARPLASIVACAGMTGCGRGRSDTKADALNLAELLAGAAPVPRSIHLSGCERSCAFPGVADATLLATAPGRYALFTASQASGGRFGRPVAGDLTVAQAVAMLRAAPPAHPPAGGAEPR